VVSTHLALQLDLDLLEVGVNQVDLGYLCLELLDLRLELGVLLFVVAAVFAHEVFVVFVHVLVLFVEVLDFSQNLLAFRLRTHLFRTLGKNTLSL